MSSIASSSTPKRAKPAATALRSHLAGALTRADVGREVRLGGWVHRRRDLGGLVFVDLRDRAGLVQLSCNPAWTPPEVMGPTKRMLNRAMDAGLTQAQAAEVITHLAFYAGWPNAFSALPVAKEVFEKRQK